MNKEIVNDGIIEEKQQELPTEKRWSWIIANVTNETAMPAIRKTIGVIAPEELDITLPLIFEEIYTNISHYSYPLESKLKKAVITLIDRKKEFIMKEFLLIQQHILNQTLQITPIKSADME